MREPSLTAPPKRPICLEPDGVTSCRFAGTCSAARQVLQAGYSKSLLQWVRDREPLRGNACWAYIGQSDKLAQPALASARYTSRAGRVSARVAHVNEGA